MIWIIASIACLLASLASWAFALSKGWCRFQMSVPSWKNPRQLHEDIILEARKGYRGMTRYDRKDGSITHTERGPKSRWKMKQRTISIGIEGHLGYAVMTKINFVDSFENTPFFFEACMAIPRKTDTSWLVAVVDGKHPYLMALLGVIAWPFCLLRLAWGRGLAPIAKPPSALFEVRT